MAKNKARPPVVVVLGHVDHGKTTLLDYIRRSHIAEKEYGAITQSIGAYEIELPVKGYPTNKITFIDTPGHAAFSKLRERGANVADIAILVIDAKESVKPQTEESIEHIKKAGIPFIAALNKIDLPDANPQKVMRDLQRFNVLVEDMGGDVVALPISAKTGQGVQDLLEAVLLLSSEMEIRFSPDNPLTAFIIETKKDKRGIVVSIVIKDGRIRISDTIYSSETQARVRAMFDDLGQSVQEAEASKPLEILGFEEFPKVGDIISTKKDVVRKHQRNIQSSASKAPFDIEAIFGENDKVKKLQVILKADTHGSLEAISSALSGNSRLEVLSQDVGDITKSDVFMARSAKAIILGFNIKASHDALQVAKDLKIIIRTYRLIYELLDEVEEVIDLLEQKEFEEKVKGKLKILAQFIIDGQKIFGGKVVKGKISLGDKVLVKRGDMLLGESKIASLKIRARSVEEVKAGQECGILLQPVLDLKPSDMIESIL